MAILPQPSVPVKIGRYRILKPLGQGGMGAVYLAQDTELDRQVALKIPNISNQDNSSVLERFYREARAAATLRHAHICPLFDIGEHQGVPYLTMAYIEGKSLGEFARGKSLTHKSIAILVRKLALALQEAHQRGIIHRDLKPANIMIDKRGEPIVMDFGLARRLSRDDTRLTQTGAAIGTPAYMPPEQISANAELMGPACDIYSLGVILYELLTGRLPFEGDAMAMLAQILTDEPRRPSELQANIDPALEAICLKAMAKKPADRFGSMVEMAARLMDYLKGKTPEPPAQATVVPLAAETKPSGIHLSMLGGLRSMAQAGMQMRQAKPAPEGPPLKRKRKKQKLPAWVWVSVGGGAVAVLIAIIAIVWSVSGSATARVIPTAPEAAAFVAPEKPRDSQDAKEPAQRTESPEANRTEPDGAPPSTPPTPIVGAKSVPEAPLTASGLGALQGEWVVTWEQWKGRPITDKELKENAKRLIFEGDQLTFIRQSTQGETLISRGKIEIKAGDMDFRGTDYLGKPREYRGIFELTGDTLRLAYPNTNTGLIRPTAFESTAMDDTLVIVAKRKPADIAQKPIAPERSPQLITPNRSPEPQWTSLFNGRNLSGWKTHPNDKARWEVKNGILIGSGEPGLLFTQRDDYEDVHFRVEARVSALGNSGQFFRAKYGSATPKRYDGYEAQISTAQADQRTGSLYNFVKITQQLHQPGQWFTQEVIVQGNHIIILLNNEKVVDFHDQANTFRRGHLALQQQNRNGTIEFRKVEVKELPPGWSDARNPSEPVNPPIMAPASSLPVLIALRELPAQQNKGGPWLSPDGLSLYWTDKQGEIHSIWRAGRSGPDQPFVNATRILGGHDLTLSADLTELIRVDYDPNPQRGQKFALFSDRKASASDREFARAHRKLTEMAGLGHIAAPCLSSDGLTLYAEQFGDPSLPPNVRFTRSSPDAPWGRPEAVPLSGLTKAHLRFPFISADNRFLFGNNDDSPSGMVMLTSLDGGRTFGSPKPIKVPGDTVKGKFPRYCPATKELIFSESTTAKTAEIFIIRNFDPDAPGN